MLSQESQRGGPRKEKYLGPVPEMRGEIIFPANRSYIHCLQLKWRIMI